jgi:hypothetical protein
MASHKVSKIFIIGGTGAQGIPVVKALVADHRYTCRVLTRDTESTRAKQLLALGNIELIEGTFANEDVLREGYKGCDGAFVNLDGFNSGEKGETYCECALPSLPFPSPASRKLTEDSSPGAIRAYELALESGIKFFVYGNLDYVYKLSGYDPKFRIGHYDGKGRMGEWILDQTKANGARMGAALFTTGPYIEMAISSRTIMTPTVENGIVTWRAPLEEGSVVHVALEDCGYYVRWLFDNPSRASGMNLAVAIAHIPYSELAAAFEKVTGHPAQYIDTPPDEYFSTGAMAAMADQPAGYNAAQDDPATMSYRNNFTGFWNMWKHSGGNKGVIKRNYALLDEIFPGRTKSAEEWFRKEDERGRKVGLGGLWDRVQRGNLRPILKVSEDGRKGIL